MYALNARRSCSYAPKVSIGCDCVMLVYSRKDARRTCMREKLVERVLYARNAHRATYASLLGVVVSETEYLCARKLFVGYQYVLNVRRVGMREHFVGYLFSSDRTFAPSRGVSSWDFCAGAGTFPAFGPAKSNKQREGGGGIRTANGTKKT